MMIFGNDYRKNRPLPLGAGVCLNSANLFLNAFVHNTNHLIVYYLLLLLMLHIGRYVNLIF